MTDTIDITKQSRVHAIVDRTVTYRVDAEAFKALTDDGLSVLDALEALRSEANAETVSYSDEVDDVTEVHEESVEVEEPKSAAPRLGM